MSLGGEGSFPLRPGRAWAAGGWTLNRGELWREGLSEGREWEVAQLEGPRAQVWTFVALGGRWVSFQA